MPKRVTLFAGHYGSGKTNLAVEYALRLRSQGLAVTLADLDIVNPYFRAKDSRQALEAAGVRFISSAMANSNVDTPALPAEAYAVTDDRASYAVVDVGGDDRGAMALGRFAAAIGEEDDYAMYLVVNMYRPLTRTPADALKILREVEGAGGLRFTGIVNNSNLGADTTAQDVAASRGFVDTLRDHSGLPIVATTVLAPIAAELEGLMENVTPIGLHFKAEWTLN